MVRGVKVVRWAKVVGIRPSQYKTGCLSGQLFKCCSCCGGGVPSGLGPNWANGVDLVNIRQVV